MLKATLAAVLLLLAPVAHAECLTDCVPTDQTDTGRVTAFGEALDEATARSQADDQRRYDDNRKFTDGALFGMQQSEADRDR